MKLAKKKKKKVKLYLSMPLHSYLTPALDRRESLPSRLGRLTPGKEFQPQSRSGSSREEINYFSVSELETRIILSVA